MNKSRWLAIVALALAASCGPTVEIVSPQDGQTVPESSTVAVIKFTAPSRTFTVALDGSEVTSRFFATEKTASGTLSGLANGQHVLQVEYTSKVGFQDTDEVLFNVEAEVELRSLAISPTPVGLQVGGTAQLSVTGYYSDGETDNLTPSSKGTSYMTSASNIATISSEGLVTAIAAGTAIVTATNQTVSAPVTVTVTSTTGQPTPTPTPSP